MESSHRLFRFPKPAWLNNATTRTAGVYASGALFSLGFFTFLDAAVYSHSPLNGSTLHITFVDWIPLICSALGMAVINSIEKSRLNADSFSYSGNGVAWKARLVLFLGFALIAGGLAGSVTIMVLNYLMPSREGAGLEDGGLGDGDGFAVRTIWMGVANVVGNALVMLSCIVLWVSQNMEDDYTYNLAL